MPPTEIVAQDVDITSSMSTRSSTPRTRRSWEAAASTAPFTARLDRSCWPNVARSAAARPAKRESPAVTGCRRDTSFTPSARYGTGGGHGESMLLAACYRNALRLAQDNGVTSDRVSGDQLWRLRLSARRSGRRSRCAKCAHSRAPAPRSNASCSHVSAATHCRIRTRAHKFIGSRLVRLLFRRAPQILVRDARVDAALQSRGRVQIAMAQAGCLSCGASTGAGTSRTLRADTPRTTDRSPSTFDGSSLIFATGCPLQRVILITICSGS